MSNADYGWIAIAVFAAAHNTVAAGRGKEFLSSAMRRYRRAHPILVPLAGGVLLAHLMGYINPKADPIYQIGVLAEKLAGLFRA